MKHKHRIVIAAGGTGGHFFPALALGMQLKKHNIDITFLTDERTVFPEELIACADIMRIRLSKLKGLKGYLLFVLRMVYALPTLLRWLHKNQVDAVVGFGGYPSVPALLAAALLKVPIVLHEQNAKAGRVNRMFAKWAKIITVAFEHTEDLTDKFTSKCRVTGNPVRPRFVQLQSSEVPWDQKNVCLILGGSQGAAVMSKWIAPTIASLPKERVRGMVFMHQSRPEDLESVRALYAANDIHAHVETFFTNVPELMQRARFVIARAGASTISELAVLGCPAILLPYPNAMDDHQASNARAVALGGGAIVIDERTADVKYLESTLLNMLQDEDMLLTMSSQMKAMGVVDASERMHHAIISILS